MGLKYWRRINRRRVSRRIKLGKTKKYRNFDVIKGAESKCSRELKNVIKNIRKWERTQKFQLNAKLELKKEVR